MASPELLLSSRVDDCSLVDARRERMSELTPADCKGIRPVGSKETDQAEAGTIATLWAGKGFVSALKEQYQGSFCGPLLLNHRPSF
jgi:hypothetical protein